MFVEEERVCWRKTLAPALTFDRFGGVHTGRGEKMRHEKILRASPAFILLIWCGVSSAQPIPVIRKDMTGDVSGTVDWREPAGHFPSNNAGTPGNWETSGHVANANPNRPTYQDFDWTPQVQNSALGARF